jgi:hypothetical protein
LRPEFAAGLTEGATLALGIHTEKTRSEFIITPRRPKRIMAFC